MTETRTERFVRQTRLLHDDPLHQRVHLTLVGPEVTRAARGWQRLQLHWGEVFDGSGHALHLNRPTYNLSTVPHDVDPGLVAETYLAAWQSLRVRAIVTVSTGVHTVQKTTHLLPGSVRFLLPRRRDTLGELWWRGPELGCAVRDAAREAGNHRAARVTWNLTLFACGERL